MKLFFLLLGIVAFGLGVYMIFDDTLMSALGPMIRTMFIGLLLVYGAFRMYTGFSKKHGAGSFFRSRLGGGAQ